MRIASVVLLALALTPSSRARAAEAETLRDALGALIASRNYAAALEQADTALAADEDSVVAWQYRAYALHQLGRTTTAREAYERTIALDPENWWAHMNLGSLLASEQRWNEAVSAAARATTLRPESRDAWARLTQIHRDRLAFDQAAKTVRAALAAAIDPVWCREELADLAWILGDRETARAQWALAEEIGSNAETVAHGRRLLDWDDEIRRTEPLHPSAEWVFRVGKIEVRTLVGTKLPRKIEALVTRVQRGYECLLGVRGDWPFEVRIRLSRTVEEHEAHRRREFPQGHRGAAFHIDRRWRGGPGRMPRSAPRAGRFEIYLAWSEPGIERRLSHEMLHSVLRMRVPSATDLPMWLDEGLATYMELAPDERGRLVSGTVRQDLLASLAAAREAEEMPSLARFLGMQYREFRNAESRAHYAQAWSVVHFLLEKRGGRRRLVRYLDALDQPRVRAMEEFRGVYGDDLTALHTDWWAYVDGLMAR